MAAKVDKGKRKLSNGRVKIVPEDGYSPMNGRIAVNGICAVKASHAPQRITKGVAAGADHATVYMSDTLVFYVNGREVKDSKVDPSWTLLYYLRNKLRLCGTKLGCAEGGCGACTVMVSSYDHVSRKIKHLAVNACLTPVCAMHGLAVTTVEGIGSTRTRLHPVQERLAKSHGSQCGFCTPGFVMSMYALLRSIPKPTMEHLEVAFQGNLCRCTGYRPILEGFRTFTEEWEHTRLQSLECNSGNGGNEEKGVCGMGDQCCRRKKAFTSEAPSELVDTSAFAPYDPTQEPIFPPKLQTSPELNEQYLIIQGKEVTWYRPTKLGEVLVLKDQYPNAKIIVGNTEVGVEVKFKHFVYPVLIQPTRVKEMREIVENKQSLKIGASVTLMELEDALREQIRLKPEHQTRVFSEVVEMLHWFAGKQIRNVAAVGGNIMTGSPISDLVPIFMATGVKLNLCSYRRGHRTVLLDHNFFTGYRRNVVEADELLVSLEIPFSGEHQHLVAYKQAKRREDDIAVVNMALNVSFHPGTSVVKEATMAFGGMAPVTKVALRTCRTMVGRRWDGSLLEPVFDSLVEELPLSGDAPGGMILYRRSLTLSLFLKGFVRVAKRLQRAGVPLSDTLQWGLPRELEDVDEGFRFQAPRSSQYFQLVPVEQPERDLIGRPIVHVSALKQATGEAVYCDDLPKFEDELYLTLVTSTRARAKLLRVDPAPALELEGVVAFFGANDIPEDRRWIGAVVHDEEVFASREVFSQGQVIGAVVAVDQATAQKAARLVRVEYEDVQPVIVSIEDAILQESFFPECPKRIVKGDAEKAFLEAENVLEGEVRMGGQEHFYFETHASIAVPKENELEMFCSTQHPSEIQRIAAHVLGLHCNRINVRVKRIGGGFGGKESRGLVVAIPVAVAAYKLGKPVRCMLDRDEDMQISGTRHPFLFRYKVGFDNSGLLKVVQIHIYCNAGYSSDLSLPVLQRAMFHFENAYKIPVSDVYGYYCKTNLPSNTAFRGFGGTQGMFAAENIVRDVANYLGLDPVQVSELNLYKEGDLTHYNQPLEYCTLRRCWKECLEFSNYRERFEAVRKFNKEHRYRKRGITVIPTKFGISFSILFLNQAGALVHVYTDGSVLISHGGIEMGQGLHTKIIQVASRIFKVHPDKIHISETATDKVPNTSATAASIGSDVNGMAVMEACNRIMERLEPIMEKNPSGTWEEWIHTAYMERISLSATGFYRTPGLGYDWSTNSGTVFNYFTYGVACTEVEIDCLTGDHQLLRTDIVMDLGESLNPAIDIGQVEGAFVQGYGLFTLEEMIYSSSGTVYSRGPGAYKIPSLADIPREFNVSLLKEAPNPRAVYSSKAVGEPPLFLASSAFFAIKEAIMSARRDANIAPYFRLDSPATAAKIRTACVDDLMKRVDKPDGKQPWNVTV